MIVKATSLDHILRKEKENLGQRLEHTHILGCSKEGNTLSTEEDREVLESDTDKSSFCLRISYLEAAE